MDGSSTRESCQNILRLTFTDLAEITHVPGQKGGNWKRTKIQTKINCFLGALECWILTINFILHLRIRIAKIISLKSFLLMDWGKFFKV